MVGEGTEQVPGEGTEEKTRGRHCSRGSGGYGGREGWNEGQEGEVMRGDEGRGEAKGRGTERGKERGGREKAGTKLIAVEGGRSEGELEGEQKGGEGGGRRG